MAPGAETGLSPAERRAVERAASEDDELAAVVRAFLATGDDH